MTDFLILAINPGSTSTKIAVFENDVQIFIKVIRHEAEKLASYGRIANQFEFRRDLILKQLLDEGIDPTSFHAVIGRGGLLRPVESGVYEVNQRMKDELRSPDCLQHASNLGALIAESIASSIPGAKAYIADPVVVDEMQEVARLSGLPQYPRISIFHALNQKAIARTYAKQVGSSYEELNLVIAHLGGGISVGAHRRGRVVDVNNALYGDGPFSPERAGVLSTGAMLDLCFHSGLTEQEVRKQICGNGGLVAHMGYNDAYRLEQDAKEGNQKAIMVQEAMFYNVAKHIGAMATVLHGKVDAILVTGGIAYNPLVKTYLEEAVGYIAPLAIFPGEDEMAALAGDALMVLRGEIPLRTY